MKVRQTPTNINQAAARVNGCVDGLHNQAAKRKDNDAPSSANHTKENDIPVRVNATREIESSMGLGKM